MTTPAPAKIPVSVLGANKAALSRLRGIAAAVLLGLTVAGCGYNTIPTYEEQAKAKWADVQNNYQRRADLIPNLVATCRASPNRNGKC